MDPIESLRDFLVEHFQPEELPDLLDRSYEHEKLSQRLPTDRTSPMYQVEHVVELLCHRGALTGLFAQLEQARPLLVTKLQRMKADCDRTLPLIHASPAPPPAPPPPRKRATPVLQRLGTSAAVRYLVYTLVSFARVDRSTMMAHLGLDPTRLRGVIRGRDPGPGPGLLADICGRHSVFVPPEAVHQYLALSEPIKPVELEGVLARINGSSPAGDQLRRLLGEHRDRMRVVNDWRGWVRRHAGRLAVDGFPGWKALDDLYYMAAITWPVDLMRSFTHSDFDRTFWENVVERAQDQIPPAERNHLHHANELIGEELAKLVVADLADAKARGVPPRPDFNVIEGGVGGANTTHQVLRRILAATRERAGWKQVGYVGFEINELIATHTDLILSGDCLTADDRPDVRSEFFRRMQPPLLPLCERYVEPLDLADGVAELVADPANHRRFDLFLCSYAFHHVPNGRKIREFVFGEHRGHRLTPDDRFRRHVCAALDFWIDTRNALNIRARFPTPRDPSPQATTFLSYLPLERLARRGSSLQLKELRRDFDQAFAVRGPRHMPDSWLEVFEDQQQRVLSSVWKLLRPGGLLAISDPDGFSMYNKLNVPKNAEMGVAHFLTLTELMELARHHEFEDLHPLIQVHERGGTFEAVRPRGGHVEGAERDSAVTDVNRGYILFARKPYDAPERRLSPLYLDTFTPPRSPHARH